MTSGLLRSARRPSQRLQGFDATKGAVTCGGRWEQPLGSSDHAGGHRPGCSAMVNILVNISPPNRAVVAQHPILDFAQPCVFGLCRRALSCYRL
jgi:hypothetical protein